jgi:predicted DCC family thiol-disulfide oxidoreductase YuxK
MNSKESKSGVVNQLPDGKILVLFDGYCNLCNGAIQFIMKRDRRERFRYASLSWPLGERVVERHPRFKGVDSIIVFHKGRVMDRSSAALYIAGRLDGLWPVLTVFWIVPKFLRDFIYDWVARNRYRWFGKKSTCMMPDKDVSHLFLQ